MSAPGRPSNSECNCINISLARDKCLLQGRRQALAETVRCHAGPALEGAYEGGEAADEIARGNEAAQRVRASADRTVVETTSVAQKEADIIRGQADGKRNAIFAEAFGRDPEFFAFYRSLTAYEKSLTSDNATMIISPNSEFFDYLNSDSLNE